MFAYSPTLFSALIAFFSLSVLPAFAAPEASPKTFAGTYTFSSFANKTIDLETVNRSYQGTIKISLAGKLSGRLTKTVTSFTNFTDDFSSKDSRVTVSGKITKVRNSSHGGYKVLEATTKIKFSDGTTGILSIFNPYTVKPSQISGYGSVKVADLSGSASLQKQ